MFEQHKVCASGYYYGKHPFFINPSTDNHAAKTQDRLPKKANWQERNTTYIHKNMHIGMADKACSPAATADDSTQQCLSNTGVVNDSS